MLSLWNEREPGNNTWTVFTKNKYFSKLEKQCLYGFNFTTRSCAIHVLHTHMLKWSNCCRFFFTFCKCRLTCVLMKHGYLFCLVWGIYGKHVPYKFGSSICQLTERKVEEKGEWHKLRMRALLGKGGNGGRSDLHELTVLGEEAAALGWVWEEATGWCCSMLEEWRGKEGGRGWRDDGKEGWKMVSVVRGGNREGGGDMLPVSKEGRPLVK